VNEERRELIRRLAEAARELADDLRPIEEVSGEAWVNADWIADELEALDMALAVEALSEPEAA
jgi:hypothetical protein